jgi:predicted nucleotidyltransferase
MNFDVPSRTIYLTRHGSHAYGLATPASDLDIKGVCIEPKAYHLGYLNHFEQSERLANKGHPHDEVVYSFKKFVKLAAEANPNIIEVLFSSEEDHLKVDSFGEKLLAVRDEFISKKARHTFSGYAHAQLKRIKGHRAWLLNPPAKEPTRADFELPERTVIPADQIDAARSLVAKKLEKWHFEDMSDLAPDTRILIQAVLEEIASEIGVTNDEKWNAAGRSVGLSDNFLVILDRERKYKAASIEWQQYQNWVKTRNPVRAEQERKFGYDTKHGSHLLRLMRMCKEILEGKGVIVKRPDREDLLGVKLYGTKTYEELIYEAESLDAECNELYKTSLLRHAPDRIMLDKLVVQMIEDYLSTYG